MRPSNTSEWMQIQVQLNIHSSKQNDYYKIGSGFR